MCGFVVLHCPKFELDPRWAEEYLSYSKNDLVADMDHRLALREALKDVCKKKSSARRKL